MRLHKVWANNNECYQKGLSMTPSGIMVHSTGANNPWLKRYVQPDNGYLGVNPNGNSFNEFRPDGRQVLVHAFIGKLKDGSIATCQIAPWNMVCWHSGKGSKGAAWKMGYIGFEICEDGLNDSEYFSKVYREAVELCAFLCKKYGISTNKIICHSEGAAKGIASFHADVMHWFPKHGKNMDIFRADVERLLKGEEEEDMDIEKLIAEITPEQAYKLNQKAQSYAGNLPEPEWSRNEGRWNEATVSGLVDGNRPEAFVKRDEVIALIGRSLDRN